MLTVLVDGFSNERSEIEYFPNFCDFANVFSDFQNILIKCKMFILLAKTNKLE